MLFSHTEKKTLTSKQDSCLAFFEREQHLTSRFYISIYLLFYDFYLFQFDIFWQKRRKKIWFRGVFLAASMLLCGPKSRKVLVLVLGWQLFFVIFFSFFCHFLSFFCHCFVIFLSCFIWNFNSRSALIFIFSLVFINFDETLHA